MLQALHDFAHFTLPVVSEHKKAQHTTTEIVPSAKAKGQEKK